MSTRHMVVAAVLSGALVVTGAAYAQAPKADCPTGAAERVEGQVVKIDAAQNKVTVRSVDGATHEFQASKETLKDIKVGETLKAKLRVPEHCKKS